MPYSASVPSEIPGNSWSSYEAVLHGKGRHNEMMKSLLFTL
jgi:hypothetical protein